MSKPQGQDSLINRLRGLYKVGLGGEYGVRDFSGSMPPICKEAADRIEALEEALREASKLMVRAGHRILENGLNTLENEPAVELAVGSNLKKMAFEITQLLTTKED